MCGKMFKSLPKKAFADMANMRTARVMSWYCISVRGWSARGVVVVDGKFSVKKRKWIKF